MTKIIGNTTATPNPRPDWAQTDPTKADYIKNKPDLSNVGNYTNTTPTTITVGGIEKGTTFEDIKITDVITSLLYPYVAFTVTNPSRTPNTTLGEKGTSYTITGVSITITKGSRDITEVAIYNGGTLVGKKTGDDVKNGGTISFTGLSVDVPASTSLVLTVKVTDASGKEISKNTSGFNYVYPYYTGACAENAEINENLVEGLSKKVESKATKTWKYDCNNQCVVFAYPKTYGALTSIKDPMGNNTIGGYTKTEISITGLDNTAQTYYVYKMNKAATLSEYSITFTY
jgi:hypothetical protein